MTLQEFTQEVKEHILEYLPAQYAGSLVEVNEITKNNGLKLQGMMIHGSKNISPNIYLDAFFEHSNDGQNMDAIMEHIAEIYQKYQESIPSFDISMFNYENIKDQFFMAVINAEKNEEMLKDVPHVLKEDLALVFRAQVAVDESGDMGNILLRNTHLDYLGITEEQLYEQAKESMKHLLPPKLQGMTSILREMMLENDFLLENIPEEIMLDENMFVLTNEKKLYGAAYMFDEDVMQMVSEKLGGNFALLPSSIHETICIKEAVEFDFDELREMVKEVNRTQVSIEEQLSDSVYFYDAKVQQLSLVEEGGQIMGMEMNL